MIVGTLGCTEIYRNNEVPTSRRVLAKPVSVFRRLLRVAQILSSVRKQNIPNRSSSNIQSLTDDQLRTSIEDDSHSLQQQWTMIAALCARESAHLACEKLAFGCARWDEIETRCHASVESVPTCTSRA